MKKLLIMSLLFCLGFINLWGSGDLVDSQMPLEPEVPTEPEVLADHEHSAENVVTLYDETTERSQFSLNPVGDGITSGVAASLVIGSFFFDNGVTGLEAPLVERPKLNFLDKAYVAPSYRKTHDTVSLVSTVAAMALPVLLIAPAGYADNWLTYGVMYAESLLITYGIKEVLKVAIKRYRPYAYYEHAPLELLQESKIADSFPSGHTALAFQGAAFLISVAIVEDFPDPWKYGLIASSSALALTTAILRVTSGAHYITDVLGGAVLGTAVGIAVPLLHRAGQGRGANSVGRDGAQGDSLSLHVTPFGGGVALGVVYTQ